MSQTKSVRETIEIPIDKIKPSPYQPRLIFELEDLRESIKQDGILVPLTVRKKDGYYELIDGERRLRLSKQLGHKTVSCTVIDVDDETARRLIYKVNKQRKNYTPQEEATFFKKLVEKEGMKPYEIETQLGVDHQWVQACLNVWKFPKDIQENVFGLTPGSKAYKVYMTDVRELEPVINRNIDEAIATLREIIDKRMTYDEKSEMMTRRKRKISEETIKKAEEVIEEVAPELKKPETAEEFEEAAKALRREAKRRKTPEQKRQELVDKAQKALSSFPSLEKAEKLGVNIKPYKEKIEKIESYLKEKPKEAWDDISSLKKEFKAEIKEAEIRREEEEKRRREEEMRRRIEEEAEKRARELEEAEKRRIEEEARKKAQEEILATPELLEEVVERAREERYREFTAMEERAREAAGEIAGPLREALLRAEQDIREVKNSEKRRLLENYLIIGSVLTTLEKGLIFDIEHEDEEQMLIWKSGTPLTETHRQLKKKLELG